MKKLSKVLALLMAAAMMLFVLAACGGSDSGSAGGGGTDTPPADTTTPDTPPADGGNAGGGSGEKLKIGATYYTLQTEFCMRMDNAAKKWAEENNVDYVGYDGQNDAATQLSQVETMINNGVDAIILNPQDAEACAACVEAADAAGIPVIGVNTIVYSDKLTSYVGSLDVSAGEEIMQLMIDHMGTDTFNIVVLEGPMGQSAQLQRWEGINNVLANYPNITILDYNTANWSRSEAMSLMEH